MGYFYVRARPAGCLPSSRSLFDRWRDTSSPDPPSDHYVPHFLVTDTVQTSATRDVPTPFIPLGRGFGHKGWLGMGPGIWLRRSTLRTRTIRGLNQSHHQECVEHPHTT